MMERSSPKQEEPRDDRFWRIVCFAAVIGVAFWFTDHNLSAGSYFRQADHYTGAENRTADRVQAVNPWSAPFRIGLGLFGLGCLVLSQHRPRGGILQTLLVVYVLLLGVSVVWSVNPGVTLQKTAVVVFFGLAALGVARQLALHELAIVFSSLCLVYLSIGLALEIVRGEFLPQSSEYRFVGTIHPNSLAGYAAVCCLAAGVYSRSPNQINVWNIAIFILGMALLFLTKSRTSLAALVVALVATRFFVLKPPTRLFAASLAGLAVVCLGTFFVLSGGNARAAIGERLAMGRTHEVTSLTGRLPLWQELGVAISERPVTGHGYLAFWDKDRIESLSYILGWEIPHGHNMYLDVLLDVGLPGLLMFVAIFVIALWKSSQLLHSRPSADVAFVFGLLVFAVIHGFGESLFKMPTFLLFMLVTSVLCLDAQGTRGNPSAAGDQAGE